MLTYLTVVIFLISLGLIVFDVFDKALIALSGAILMVILGVLTPDEAIESIEFETILLLLAMMLLVNISSKSGIFSWLNVRIASITKGNPLKIFLLFSLVTFIFSAFLDNVTTVILIVPLTIELVKGMGRDPKPYIFAEIIFSNVGGALTLIGDPPNIIIGGATGFNFLQFVQNLWIPITLVMIFTLVVFITLSWKTFKPISNDLVELTIANITIRKIQYEFLKVVLHKDFIIKVILVLILTLVSFIIQAQLGLPTYVIAFAAAIILALLCSKRFNIHEAFSSVEWPTLLFFAGLFVMVGGLESTGFLEELSETLVNSTNNLLLLTLIILWASGIVSMILNNIPFIAVMIPVIMGMQSQLAGDTTILWWALSLGTCLGGNATLIGASANVVSADIANKRGVRITFLEFMKFSMPITLGMLVVCSLYLTVKIIYF